MAELSTGYLFLVYMHLATIVPTFFIGSFVLVNRKGTSLHQRLGKAYMVLMMLTGIVTLIMPARVGPQLFNHFGFIHIFSVGVLLSMPAAYFAARRGDINRHKRSMIANYIGGLVIAGAFAFMPGRLLHHWLFG